MKKMLMAALALVLGFGSSLLQAGPAHAVGLDAVLLTNVKATDCPGVTDTKFTVLQGVAGAGSYAYLIFSVPKSHALSNEAGGTMLTKWRLSDAVCVAARGNVDLGHGNDIAYHSDYAGHGPALLIPKGINSVESSSVVVLNAGDLSNSADTFSSPTSVSGICYSSVAKKFALRDDNKIYVYSETSSHTRGSKTNEITVNPASSTGGQGLDCSGDNVYDVRSIAGTTGTTNYIYQFTWSGTYRKAITYSSPEQLEPTNSTSREVEGLFHVGDQFYMGVNRNSGGADSLYKVSW